MSQSSEFAARSGDAVRDHDGRSAQLGFFREPFGGTRLKWVVSYGVIIIDTKSNPNSKAKTEGEST